MSRAGKKRGKNVAADDDDEDVGASYRWEKGAGSWDQVREDEHGRIVALTTDRERSIRAKQQRVTQSVRRGLIRYLVVCIDCSSSAGEKDLRPCRLESSKTHVKRFIREYFDQNPISQMSICVTRDRIAERITELSGNPKNHEQKLSSLMNMEGVASLQNSIELSMKMLKNIPEYGHRELLIIYSSLSTCDPGDIFATIEQAVKLKIRISVICLAAELFICRYMAEKTNGIFAVASDEMHLMELLQAQTVPPPELLHRGRLNTDFVYMGFPRRTFEGAASFGFDGNVVKLFSTAYICPRCHTRASDIPTECCVCRVQLNSSSHIARSHHHLFPVANYVEMVVSVKTRADGGSDLIATREKQSNIVVLGADGSSGSSGDAMVVNTTNGTAGGDGEAREVIVTNCKGCLEQFNASSLVMQCTQCENCFCVECDLFIHHSLHNCPGCN